MLDSFKVMQLIKGYMTYGHTQADLDPLQLEKTYEKSVSAKKYNTASSKLRKMIDYTTYGLTESDLEKTFYIDGSQLEGILSVKQEWKLRELIEALENAYCQKIGLDYMHVPDRE